MEQVYREENGERKFIIRSYGKSEFASFYMPGICPKSAGEAMRKWIAKYPGLAEALAATGLDTKDRKYTPAQVGLIVGAIGEPGI